MLPDADLAPRRFRLAVAVVVVAHLAVLATLAASLPWTQDEYSYLKAGAILRAELQWDVPHTMFHGPLPFFANQLAAMGGIAPVEPADDYLFWGRLGMLAFALVGAVALTTLLRQVFDRRTALFGLVLHAANPVVLANAPLLTCDAPLAACYVLVLTVAVKLLREPSWRGVIGLGAALGACLATKYLALFLVPVLGGALAVALWRGWQPDGVVRRGWRVLPRAGLAVVVVAVVAVLTLHTCYLWAAPGFRMPAPGAVASSPFAADAPLRSALLRAALDMPLVETVLGWLPAPFVRGIDFQKLQSEGAGETPFFSASAFGHPGYFVVSLLLKLPLAWLALAGLGLWRGAPWPTRVRTLLGLAALMPFVYLSLFSQLQNGVRYVLPTVVLLTLPAARAAVWLLERGVWSRGLLGACVGALLVCLGVTWPRFDGSFNVLAGGRPYLIFADANYDWTARDLRDQRALLDQQPAAVSLSPQQGPSFGHFVIHGGELACRDARSPGRLYHWLRRFHPTARRGGCLLFTIDEAAFAAADAAAAPRSRVELAIARFGRGDLTGARAAVAGLQDPDLPALTAALDRAEQRGSEWCDLMLGLGRLEAVVDADSGATLLQRATALWQLRQSGRACELLEAEAKQRRLSPPEVHLLATVLAAVERHDAALALLDEYAPPLDAPERPLFDSLRRGLAVEVAAWQRLRAQR